MSEQESIWVVDRIEGDVVVLIEDGTGATAQVAVDQLAAVPREGDVLRVPTTDAGPAWARARPDDELRRARIGDAEAVLEELRKRDPGGDVVL